MTEVKRSRTSKASPTSGYRRLRPQSKGSKCQGHGSRRDQDATAESGRAISPSLSTVAGRWLPRGEDKGKDWALRRPWGGVRSSLSARESLLPKRCSDGLGSGVGQRGRSARLEEAIAPEGFQVLPRRWVVERTFAWLVHNRRLSKDYERLCATGEALIYVAMTRLMVRRLARV
jgi:hypothetical protein